MLNKIVPKPVAEAKPCVNPKSINNVRLYTNTLRHAIDLIRRQGADANSIETEYDDYIEYIITVKKEMHTNMEEDCKNA